MDYEVKEALDRVLAVCGGSDSPVPNAADLLAQDIYSFISTVSKRNINERFNYFSKMYLDGKYKAEQFSGKPHDTFCLLKAFLKQNNQSSPVMAWRSAKAVVQFFAILGKTYLGSRLDRQDIDVSKVAELIKNMNERTGKEPELNSKSEQMKERTTSENKADKEGQHTSAEPFDESQEETAEPDESLEELLDKLNSLIGLAAVKKEVAQIINLIKVQKKGEEFGAKLPPMSLHLVFFGNPGTGKTTVARLFSKIYKSLGVLSKGQMVEVDRGGLVAGYVGQTAVKTQNVIDKAMGGILFIDEAYALTHGKGENDFGQEAVDTLLKAMEDHRDDFIVIVAGYPDLMKEFIASNPGLKSRFNQFISFEDYTSSELQEIFNLQCKSQGLILTDECNDFLAEYFDRLYHSRSADYANGRDVRNYFEKVIKARANRLAPMLDQVSHEEYRTITVSDLQEAERTMQETI